MNHAIMDHKKMMSSAQGVAVYGVEWIKIYMQSAENVSIPILLSASHDLVFR